MVNISPGTCVRFHATETGASETGEVIDIRQDTLLIRPDDMRRTVIEVPRRLATRATIREALAVAEARWADL